MATFLRLDSERRELTQDSRLRRWRGRFGLCLPALKAFASGLEARAWPCCRRCGHWLRFLSGGSASRVLRVRPTVLNPRVREIWRSSTAFKVLHQDGDSPVRRIVGIAFDAQQFIGKPAYLRHLVGADAVLLQQAPRSVRAIRRELPVAVIRIRGILRCIGMALQ